MKTWTGFLSFKKKYLFKYIVDHPSVFSVKHGDLDVVTPPPSLSSVSLCSPEIREGSRRSDTCALRAQAVISSARAAHRLCVSREECCPFSLPHRCKTEADRDALRGRFLLVLIPLQFVRKAPEVSAFTLNNNSLSLTRWLSLSEQYYTYFKKGFFFFSTLWNIHFSVMCLTRSYFIQTENY